MGLITEAEANYFIALIVVVPASLVAMFLSPKYRLRIGGFAAAGLGAGYLYTEADKKKEQARDRAAWGPREDLNNWGGGPENESGYF